MAIRLPVVRRRYCVQRTAFGAADVPEVKSSAHRTSTLVRARDPPAGSRAAARSAPRRALGRAALPWPEGSSPSAKRSETRTPPGRSKAVDRRIELRLVPRLGDHELHVRMRRCRVPDAPRAWCGSALPRPHLPGRRHTGRRRSRECCRAGDRHAGDGRDRGGPEAAPHSAPLRRELGVGPHPVTETQGRSVGVASSVPFRRNRAATFGAGSGTSASAGAKVCCVLLRASARSIPSALRVHRAGR